MQALLVLDLFPADGDRHAQDFHFGWKSYFCKGGNFPEKGMGAFLRRHMGTGNFMGTTNRQDSGDKKAGFCIP